MEVINVINKMINITITHKEYLIIHLCIRQAFENVRTFEFRKRIGVTEEYMRAIQCYARSVSESRPNEATTIPITFSMEKINNDLLYATMTLNDLRAIGNCIKMTLKRTGRWEIHTLIGAYAEELESLRDQIIDAQHRAFPDHSP